MTVTRAGDSLLGDPKRPVQPSRRAVVGTLGAAMLALCLPRVLLRSD